MNRDASPDPESPPPDVAPDVARDAAPDPLLALVRAAAAGRRDALARLLALVAPAISATVRVFLGRQPSEVEDTVQEALIAVTEALPRFRGDSSFLHYCRRIAVRLSLAHRRAGRRRETLASELPGEAGGRAEAGADALEREQLVRAFRQLLDELPPAQAESLAYRVVLEHSLPVIARETGAPINTVRSRIRLARDYLRRRITSDPALRELMGEDA
jgi:RNA polymerase sigma factor (sigma-70 family)